MGDFARFLSFVKDIFVHEAFIISPNAPTIPVKNTDYPIRTEKYKSFERRSASIIPKAILPNYLTYLRILICILLIVAGKTISYAHLIVLIIIGGLSDFFDGAVARARNQITRLGIVLDPMADKLLMFGVFYLLIIKGDFNIKYLPWLIAGECHIIIVPMLSLCYRLISDENRRISLSVEYRVQPLFLGRLKLHCYVYAMVFILIGRAAHIDIFLMLGDKILQLGIGAALIALCQYVGKWFRNPH